MSFGAMIWSAVLVLFLLVPQLKHRWILKFFMVFVMACLLTWAEVSLGATVMNISAVVVIFAIAALGIWAAIDKKNNDPRNIWRRPKDDTMHNERVKRAKALRDERRANGIRWP